MAHFGCYLIANRSPIQPFRYPNEVMDLPPQVLDTYVKHFQEVRRVAGSSLSSVAHHYGVLDDAMWLLLNWVVDWRCRSNQPLHMADRFVIAFWGVRCDAQNGGFSQYFTNSSGDYWPDLLRLLVLGGDADGERHFRHVLAVFANSTPSTNREDRNQELRQIEQCNPSWDELLNNEYYDGCFYPSDATLFRALTTLDDYEYLPDPDIRVEKQ